MQIRITPISRKEFQSYRVLRKLILSYGEAEKAWFIDDKKYLLGLVIAGESDRNWTYNILARYDNWLFRDHLTQDLIGTKKDAEVELVSKMRSIIISGRVQEEIYDGSKDGNIDEARIITNINEEVKKYLKNHPEKLYELSPRKFEELVASIMEDLGFSVELTQATRDGGKDIIASIRNEIANFLIYVECKRFAADRRIGVGIIREVSGVHYLRKPSKSLIVTTSFFTRNAMEEARKIKNQLELKDYDDIKSWLSRY